MAQTSTLAASKKHWLLIHLLIYLLTFSSGTSYAQTKILANTATVISPEVENKDNALLDDNSFATVKSYGGALFGAGRYSGELQLNFAADVPAGRTTFVRIDYDVNLLNSLLGGNLGSSLANVLGGVVLGNHFFTVGARNHLGNQVAVGSSSGAFATTDIKLVKDAAGLFYLAITPTAAYRSVFIKDVTNAVALSTVNNIKVYSAFYVSGTGNCDPPFATDYEGTGATLSLLGLGGAGVANIQNAIDGNTATASRMSLGLIAAAGTISQNVYFNSPSKIGDEFNIRLSVAPALVNLGLVNRITVEAYNGNVLAYTGVNVPTLLNLDLLGLLNSGQPVTIPFAPNKAFDRVKITLSSLLDVNLTQYIDIYEVSRSAPRPTFAGPPYSAVSVCFNGIASLGATTSSTNELIWYDVADGGLPLATKAFNENYSTPALSANKTYYVAARQLNCTSESVRMPVTVAVNPQINFVATTLANAAVGTAYSKQLTVATGGTPNYSYALTGNNALPPGLTLSTAGLLGGIPVQTGTFSFAITATDSKGCTETTVQTLIVTDKLLLTAATLPDGTVAVVYPGQVIPPATGGNLPYTYSAINLPSGLSFDEITREITGTPDVAGSYVITINVIDDDGNSASMNYPVNIKNALILPAASLNDGVVGMAYPVQLIPEAQGGIPGYTYTATNLPPGLNFNDTTREIAGVPTTTGLYDVTVEVKDAANVTTSTIYTIRVVAPLLLANKTLAEGTVGITYVTEILPAATGGVGPYTYSATDVPNGLLFDPVTREISGTPSGAGNFVITLKVADSEGRETTNTYALKVGGTLTLATVPLPNGIVGSAYPVQVLPAVSGGVGPYVYGALNLPGGLSFNTTTRELSGTPLVGGNFTFAIKVTDQATNTVTTNYQISISVNAPMVATTTICSGTSTTLTVTNPQAGVTYNWYGATGSRPLAANNNGTFITGNIGANTVFYVEAVSGTAISSRTAVNVSTNPRPSAVVMLTNNQTVNVNQSTVVRAGAEIGHTVNWYGQPTGGAILASGEEFVTGNLAVTTTFYAEAVSGQGCVSATRTPVVVTVITAGAGANCNAANAQSSGIVSLLCVLCNVANPGNAVDADQNNFTRITLSVGVAATGFQRLIFPSTGLATDSIRLDLATPTGLLDLSVLGGITVNVMKNNVVVRTLQLNSSLVNLQLLGGNRFEATFAAGAEFDRVEVRFQAVVAALSSLDIYGAQIVYPNPTVVGNNQTICYNTNATITATANGNTQIKWYNATGDELATTATYTTPNLTASTAYYIEVSRDGCANTNRVPVVVNVVPLLAVPTFATPTITACEGSPVTLAVDNPNPAITYRWYENAVGGAEIHTGSTYTVSNVSTTKIYYVAATQLGCTSAPRAAIEVTVSPLPVLPQVQASVSTINAGQTVVLTASSVDNNIDFNWFTSLSAVTPVHTGAIFVTPPLNATTSYYVEARSSLTGCVSPSRVMVTITVNGGGAPNPTPCVSPIGQENGVDGGITLLAGVSNAGLAIDNDTQTGSTLFLPVGALGGYVYQRLTFASESNAGDTVKVLVSSPGKLLSLNLLGSVQLTTLKGGASNNDLVNLNNALINLELLSGGSQALLTFVPAQAFDQVEVRLNGGLVATLNSLNVNYARHVVAVPEVVANAVSVCNNAAAELKVKNPKANLTYKWYNEAGVYQADGVTFTTSAITASTKFFVTANSATGCESGRTIVDVTVIPTPMAPEVLSSNISTCAGGNVVVQIKDPVDGYTYRWYDSSNTLVFEGAGFTVNNVVAPANYTVVAVVTACNTPSTPTAIQVNVGTLDVPIVATPNITISPNAGAVLTATSSTPNAVINWYANIGDVTPFHTGNSYLTPPLTANTTYYVEAAIPASCTSTRIPMTVTVVSDGTTGQVPCVAATVERGDGTNNLALLSEVFNPGLAVDDKIETASSLVMTAGLVGAYVYQRVGFTTQSTIGDTVKVRITSPGKLLSLGVLPSISVLTYNGATSNSDILFANNSLISLALLSDGSAATLSFVPTQQFDAVELRLNSGLASVLTSVDFNYAQRVGVAPQVEIATASTCAGTAAVLSVKNPIAGVDYRWYLDNTYQNVGNSFSTPNNLAAGTYNYYVRAVVNGCESSPTKVEVTILPVPVPPTPLAGNPTNVCFGSAATLGVAQGADLSVTYNWYDANGTLLTLNSLTYTTPTNLPVGIHNFFVAAINANTCANTNRTQISITVGERALASDIQVIGATNVCVATSATLNAGSTSVTNPVFKWYSDVTLTVLEYTGDTFVTPTITTSKTYYVTVTGDNKCENTSGAKEVIININPPATTSDLMVSPSTEVCGAGSVTLTASSVTVTNPVFTWYNDATLNTVAGSGASFTTPNLSASQTYYVTVKGDNKCESPVSQVKTVTVTVRAIAVAADVAVAGVTNICVSGSTSLTATSTTVSNPIFTWYDEPTLTNSVFVGTTLTTGTLTADKTYYVTVKGDNKCENLVASVRQVTVTVKTSATGADLTVSPTATLCGPGSATLMASSGTVTNPIFTWYSDAALNTVAGSGANFTTPLLAASQTYYVTVKGDNRCESAAADAKTVNVIVKPFATAADLTVSPAAEICGSGTATLTATSTTVTNPIFTWYNDATLTTVAGSGASFTTPVLSADQTYYVTVKGDDRCESPVADARTVKVTVKQRAVATDVTIAGNTNICENTAATLTASSTTVSNAIFTWYDNAALTNVVHTGATFAPILAANKTYYVTVKGDNRCENLAASVASVTVTVTVAPVAPIIATAGTTVCNNNSTTLTVSNVQTGAIYEWYNSQTGGTLLHTGVSYTTPVLMTSTEYFVQAVGTIGCTNASIRVRVAVTVAATPANPTVVSANVTTCGNAPATLQVSNPVADVTYNWFNAGGTAVGSGTTFVTPNLTANATYFVGASVGSCTSAGRTQVDVQVGIAPNPPANVAVADAQLCAGSSTTLIVNNPVTGLVYRWYSTATGGTALYEGTSYTTMPLSATTDYHVEAVATAGNCVSSTRTPVTVNVLQVFAAPVVHVGSITANSIQFSWNPVPGATSYSVSTDGQATWTTVMVANYMVTGLAQGQSATIVVKAIGQSPCQASAGSSAVTATTTEPFKDELYIPNTFTPNHDGKNDTFMAYGNSVAKFKLRVYNQWGEFIFESQNLMQGWDGTYRGRAQPSGVYVYYVEVTFNSGVSKIFKGTVTLLR